MDCALFGWGADRLGAVTVVTDAARAREAVRLALATATAPVKPADDAG